MPYRKSNYRKNKRYNAKRVAQRAGRRKVYNRILGENTPLPRIQKALFKWTYASAFSGAKYHNLICTANGLFDPHISGGAATGSQPLGFDQLMTLYDNYLVIGAQIVVDVINMTSNLPIYACIAVSENTTASTTIDPFNQQTTSKCFVVGGVESGRCSKKLIMNINPAKFFGISKPTSEDDLKGTATANPAKPLYFHLYFRASDDFTNIGIQYNVQIKYHTLLNNPCTDVPASS